MEKYRKLKYSDFNDFKNRNYNNGVLTLNLTSWGEFHRVVQIFKTKTDYIWRGQRCQWLLKSSFDRDREFWNINDRQARLDEIFDKFKQKLDELPEANSHSFTEDEIWATGQHYGLPTPLLDWTESPYVAAYMAFFKKGAGDQGENRVIYALNRALKLLLSISRNAKTKDRSKSRFVQFDLDLNPDILAQNKRLRAQKGKFTKALNGDDIKENVQRLWKKRKYNEKIILAEIVIPDKVRDDCMAFLRTEGITHGSLFPDYAGVVDICKIELGMDKSK